MPPLPPCRGPAPGPPAAPWSRRPHVIGGAVGAVSARGSATTGRPLAAPAARPPPSGGRRRRCPLARWPRRPTAFATVCLPPPISAFPALRDARVGAPPPPPSPPAPLVFPRSPWRVASTTAAAATHVCSPHPPHWRMAACCPPAGPCAPPRASGTARLADAVASVDARGAGRRGGGPPAGAAALESALALRHQRAGRADLPAMPPPRPPFHARHSPALPAGPLPAPRRARRPPCASACHGLGRDLALRTFTKRQVELLQRAHASTALTPELDLANRSASTSSNRPSRSSLAHRSRSCG